MLHFDTVTPALLNIIRTVCAEPFFRDFRLVGGTALSLHLGHRISVDADFFSNQAFDQPQAIATLARTLPGFLVLKKSPHGFAATSEGVKLDVYTWPTPFLLPKMEAEGVRMAALPDIAALKMEAITNRKEEKDFRDIYALLERFSLAELLQFFREHYPNHSPRLLTDHLLAAPFLERDHAIRLIAEVPWTTITADIVLAVTSFYEEAAKQRGIREQEQLQKRLHDLKNKKS